MCELIDKLRTAGEQARGTDLGALLQWAALHIESQNEALKDEREEAAPWLARIQDLEARIWQAREAMHAAVVALRVPDATEYARDFAGHINLMAGHGDPDYLMSNGMPVRHIDLREKPPRKKAAPKPKD